MHWSDLGSDALILELIQSVIHAYSFGTIKSPARCTDVQYTSCLGKRHKMHRADVYFQKAQLVITHLLLDGPQNTTGTVEHCRLASQSTTMLWNQSRMCKHCLQQNIRIEPQCFHTSSSNETLKKTEGWLKHLETKLKEVGGQPTPLKQMYSGIVKSQCGFWH